MSIVLILHDPDTALQKKVEDVLHWMAIPGGSTGLPGGMSADAKLPDGTIQAKNLRGAVGFMGPGAGAAGPYHHYTFELFALDTKLDLGPDATRADVLKAIDGHILGKGVPRRPFPPLEYRGLLFPTALEISERRGGRRERK